MPVTDIQPARRWLPACAAWIVLVLGACGGVSVADGYPPRLTLHGADGHDHVLAVEVADTEELRRRGLMYRETLPPDAGMLLLYPVSRPVSIWMKNTYLPLDLLYIDPSGKISMIVAQAVPLSETSHSSGRPVRAVLEINGGRAAELGVRPGDVVEFPPVWP